MKKTRLCFLTTIVLACGLAGCKTEKNVGTETVKRATVVSTLIISGRVEASHRAIVAAPFEGVVLQLKVSQGQRVNEGDPLVIFDEGPLQEKVRSIHSKISDIQGKIRNLTSQYDFAAKDVERLKSLLKSRSIAATELEKEQLDKDVYKNDLDAQQMDLRIAYSDLASVQDQIRESTLKAPIKGVVTSTWVAPEQFIKGTAIRLGDPLVTISGGGTSIIRAGVREQDVLSLSPGLPLKISLDAIPNRTWPGKIQSLEDTATIDANTGVASYKTVLAFASEDPSIRSGMEADVTVTLGEKSNVVAVPRAAIHTHDGASSILIKDDLGFVETPVRIGLVGDTMVEVLQGLAVGQTIASVYEPDGH